MMASVEKWRDRLYPSAASRDAACLLVDMLQERIGREMTVVDVGAGAGEMNRYDFKGTCRELI